MSASPLISENLETKLQTMISKEVKEETETSKKIYLKKLLIVFQVITNPRTNKLSQWSNKMRESHIM